MWNGLAIAFAFSVQVVARFGLVTLSDSKQNIPVTCNPHTFTSPSESNSTVKFSHMDIFHDL